MFDAALRAAGVTTAATVARLGVTKLGRLAPDVLLCDVDTTDVDAPRTAASHSFPAAELFIRIRVAANIGGAFDSPPLRARRRGVRRQFARTTNAGQARSSDGGAGGDRYRKIHSGSARRLVRRRSAGGGEEMLSSSAGRIALPIAGDDPKAEEVVATHR
jgi:hypothetical protein